MNNLKPSKSELIKLLEYFNSERYKEAEILALSITEKFPNHPFGWKILGSILRKEGKVSEALFFNKKAVKLDPEDANAHNNLGNNLNDLSRLVEAEESYRQAIILNPNFAEAYNNLGNTLNSLQKPADAEENFKKAIILRPGFSESRYSLGLLLYEAADYEKAIEYFKGSDFKKSQHYLLKCFFRQDNKSFFYDQLDHLIEKSEIDPMIGSLVCRSQLRYGLERPNLFCKYPLNYVLKKDLINQYDFENIFVKPAKNILNKGKIENKGQNLLINGYQTSGNLFDIESKITNKIKKIIYSEIEVYRNHFKDSAEGFLTSWPKHFTLYGWLINMRNGGKLKPHMHDSGWISGSIYINVPLKSKTDSGNLVVCLEDQEYESEENKDLKVSIDVISGSLCFFPSSLLHYTIPFESDEERIVLAFDVVPK
jgi:tetratricopeptide (TPR) repeat protein|tara:strand:+ start:252 stop:1526 length:1275 start_codon:yes stop_codon:yes gene_type:complete